MIAEMEFNASAVVVAVILIRMWMDGVEGVVVPIVDAFEVVVVSIENAIVGVVVSIENAFVGVKRMAEFLRIDRRLFFQHLSDEKMTKRTMALGR